MTPEAIRDLLAEKLGAEIAWQQAPPGDPWAMVPAEHWHAACKLARHDEALFFDFLRAQTGTDYPDDEQIEVICHLFSYKHRHAIVLKTRVDRKDPKLDTLVDVWPAADWYEREIFDLLGVHFDGHPDLRRLVLPEDWVGHPLRKDYQEQDDYNGIPTTRPGYPKFEPGGKKKKKDRPAKEATPKEPGAAAAEPVEEAPPAEAPPPIPSAKEVAKALTSAAPSEAAAEGKQDGEPPTAKKPDSDPGEGGGES